MSLDFGNSELENLSEETKSPAKVSLLARILRLGTALNYDFCPNLNVYVYWLKKPIGWLIVGIPVCGLAGFLVASQAFVVMWALLAVLAIGVAWPWLSMQGVSCSLSMKQARSEEGKLATAVLEVVNHWPIPVFGLTLEGKFLQDINEESDEIAVALQSIPAWSSSRFTWQFRPPRRGMLPAEAPEIANGFPFGLYRVARTVQLDRPAIVWPRSIDLNTVPELNGAQFNIDGGTSQRSGTEGDVIGARDFRRGDSLRQIHWAQTARRGKWIVRERQTHTQQPISVVVDLDPTTHIGMGSDGSYEWSIRAAAAVCRHLHQHHSQLVIRCLGLAEDVDGESNNTKGIGVLLDFLAGLPDQQTPDQNGSASSKEIFASAADPLPKNGQVYLVCTSRSKLAAGRNAGVARIVLQPEAFAAVDTDPAVLLNPAPAEAGSACPEQISTQWEAVCHAN